MSDGVEPEPVSDVRWWMSEVNGLKHELARLRVENGRFRALVHEVASSPVTLDDEDLDYVEVMIENTLWRDLSSAGDR